jgi:uncharacterized transporter YbjL
MAGVFHFLHGQPFFVIFGVVALGMWLGRQKTRGIALGSVVCIILVGLLTSIWPTDSAGSSTGPRARSRACWRSNNSSATFGAAASAVQSDAFHATQGSSADIVTATLAAAFALCYTVSQVQFVLLMKLLPRLARFDAPAAAQAFEASMRGEHAVPLPGTVEPAR